MSKFCKGDRVVCVFSYSVDEIGKLATVIEVTKWDIRIKFEDGKSGVFGKESSLELQEIAKSPLYEALK